MPSNDTQRVEKLTGDCEQWHAVGSTNDFGVTFTNSWANTGGGAAPAGFYKDPFNTVYLRGVIDSGATANSAFTLPLGYRPEYELVFVVFNNNGGPGPGGAEVRVTVQTNGNVVPVFTAGTDIRLDGVIFRAA